MEDILLRVTGKRGVEAVRSSEEHTTENPDRQNGDKGCKRLIGMEVWLDRQASGTSEITRETYR